MTRLALILTCVVAGPAYAGSGSEESQATQIIGRYLKLPYPKEEASGEARTARLKTLVELKAMPKGAVPAIGRALVEVDDARRRAELAETLGSYLPTQASAKLLCELLKDPNERVRWQAIHGLRLLARRTDRVGGKRTERGPEFAPKVARLVPHLILAAGDESEQNRVGAMYALADTRDPAAVRELRSRLKDPSARVRFFAACFLTEFQDAAGLPEMRTALARLRKTGPADNLRHYGEAEMLLASFERITGKGFGEIPMNPTLLSDSREVARVERCYKNLLGFWAEWWAWEPELDDQ